MVGHRREKRCNHINLKRKKNNFKSISILKQRLLSINERIYLKTMPLSSSTANISAGYTMFSLLSIYFLT